MGLKSEEKEEKKKVFSPLNILYCKKKHYNYPDFNIESRLDQEYLNMFGFCYRIDMPTKNKWEPDVSTFSEKVKIDPGAYRSDEANIDLQPLSHRCIALNEQN